MDDKFIEGIAYAMPALVTGFVAYYILSVFIKQDNHKSKFMLLLDKKKQSLPIKLQAYERMLLFCERINPLKLMIRIKPIEDKTASYLHLLTANIEQEFEHNLVQQLYVSDQSWEYILTTKLAIITKLKKLAETAKTATELKEMVFLYYSKNENPSNTAVFFLKQEVRKLL
ncbi:MAG: hypothetical protein ACK5H1_07590 [Tenacibaculum sp.]